MIPLWFSQIPLVSLRSSAAFVALMLAGCASSPILARLDDAQVRSMLAEKCPVGSTEPQVHAGLDALGVSKGSRIEYAATPARPRVLLARQFEDRGPWLSSDDADIEWLDISFVFSNAGALERTLLFRDKIRYVRGDPIVYPNAPRRPLAGTLHRYPSPIPPPVDPLEGAQ